MRPAFRRAVVTVAGLWLAIVVPGCGPGRRPTEPVAVADREEQATVRERIVVAPKGLPARHYGASVRHRLTPIESAIAAALQSPTMRHDPGLSRMTRELARTKQHGTAVPPALLDGLLTWAGLIYPFPRVIGLEIRGAQQRCTRVPAAECEVAIAALVEQTRGTAPAGRALSFGVGVVASSVQRTRMVVSVLEPGITLRPVPRRVASRSTTRLRGRLLGGRRRPVLMGVNPDGRGFQQPLAEAKGAFSGEVSCQGMRGVQQIEVLAEGAYGIEVVANFPIYCGTDVPRTIVVDVERLRPGAQADALERDMLMRINEERSRYGVAPVSWDPQAAAIARAHSEDMRSGGFVGHRSPRTGDVRARFERARVASVVIRENVARGYGPRGIHESLMRSPGHRANILAADVTHVGIGVVIGRPENLVAEAPRPLFCTQNYVRQAAVGATSRRSRQMGRSARLSR